MQQKHLLLLVFLAISACLSAQNRAIDGSGNNVNHPEWGAAQTPLLRYTTVKYEDKIGSPTGSNRPNARVVSNVLFQQDSLINDPLGMSAITWVWGQFIDHGIDLTSDNTSEPNMIPVPRGDQWMDPQNSGNALIPMFRSKTFPGTGTSPNYPREQPNEITSFIDGSNVYGSDDAKADWLRSHIDGKLKLPNNLLPFNTYDGGIGSTIDPNAPEMANPFGAELYFVAGDVRANENILLTSIHTMMAREHNRQCDLLKQKHPDWNDEQLYQYARKMVGGFEQSITYNEWMPLMGIHLPEYTGYKPNVNPSIMNVFSGAAYRQGHTLLTGDIVRLDADGNVIPQGNTVLKHAFFNPMMIYNEGGVDPLFRGMVAQIQQDLDVKMVSDVRNYLFGDPGQGGLDLAAINIQRGRERGLPDFNKLREDFGLPKYTTFAQITANTELATKLENLYGDINDIDPWVGLLAEDHMPGKLFGPTLFEIMYDQFLNLRDGDRFYYENDPVLTDDEKTEIRNTKLIDLIMRNTDIHMMQGDPFQAMPHDDLEDCGATTPFVNIDVNIQNTNGSNIKNVNLNIDGYDLIDDGITNEDGNGYFTSIPVCKDYIIEPSKVDEANKGISVSDIIYLAGHILGTVPFTDPYTLLASDVNFDNKINVKDIIRLRKVLLLLDLDFGEGVKNWYFVNSNFTFDNPTNPFTQRDYTTTFEAPMINEDKVASFVGYKLGDINSSYLGFKAPNLQGRSVGTFTLNAENKNLEQDDIVTVNFNSDDFNQVEGFQFTLNYDPELLELLDVKNGILNQENYGIFENEGAITIVWNKMKTIKGTKAFGLNFRAKENVTLANAISLNARKIEMEAVNHNMEPLDIALRFTDGLSVTEASNVFDVYQNYPNPFTESTQVGFNLPKGSDVTMTISNNTGQVLSKKTNHFEAGYNEIKITNLPTGVYFYEISSDFGTKTKSLIVID